MDRLSGDSGKRWYPKFLMGFRGTGKSVSSFVLLSQNQLRNRQKEGKIKGFFG